jgi:hypothetical protein
MEDYLILGACNPALAHRALGIHRQIGQLLPCNVVVRTDPAAGGDTVLVEAMDPQIMVEVTGEPGALQEVADQAAAKLQAAMGARGGRLHTNRLDLLSRRAQPGAPVGQSQPVVACASAPVS